MIRPHWKNPENTRISALISTSNTDHVGISVECLCNISLFAPFGKFEVLGNCLKTRRPSQFLKEVKLAVGGS